MSVNHVEDEALRTRWLAHFQNKHPTWPVELVTAIVDLDISTFGGMLREFRFVPIGWSSPRHYHRVLIIPCNTQCRAVVEEMRAALAAYTQPVSWGADVIGENYVARVDYHPTDRPVLVCIGGVR